nr:breast cancer type 2 susceptibility protein homolog [Maniola hyperantus]
MDTDEDVINNFANALRNRHVQRKVSLYSENRSQGNSGTDKYDVKDVISGVAKQLKAIQNADNFKKRPFGNGIPNQVKKSSFLPVYMVPVDQPPKQIQSHKFETQCILDTQLINIIDNAEAIIDAEKGITQEFDTTFCHKDLEQSMHDELFSISQKPSFVFKDNGAINNKSKSPDKPNCHLDRNETNTQLHDCNISDSNTVKHIDEEKIMIQEFDTTFAYKHLEKNIEEKNVSQESQEHDDNNAQEKNTENDNIQAKKASLTEERAIAKMTFKNFVPKTDTQSIVIDVCDNFDTQCKIHFDTYEDDCDSQNKELINNPKSIVEEPKSPILNKIRRKENSNTRSPLIFELETFEKFETLALSVIENYDFETAKRVINSQILNRELFMYTHAETVLSDRDKNIQMRSSVLESRKTEQESSYGRCTENKLHLKEDSMLFSSDEENDVQNNVDELPLTCAINNLFHDKPNVLDKTMYVGFQTASNKSIQISTDSYCKAKTIFDNFENVESEHLPGTNVEALDTKPTTSNIDTLDHVNMNDETNNDYDDIVHCFETTIGETFNVFNQKDSISYNEDKIKNNAQNQSDNVKNLPQLHQSEMNGNNRIQLREEVKETCKSTADVKLSSTGKIKDSKFDNNFAEHLKFDEHILEEFNTALMPEIASNKIDKLTKGDINDFIGFRTANNNMIKISTQALMKTRNVFENIDCDDNLPQKSKKQSFETPCLLHRRKSETISTGEITKNICLESTSKTWPSHTKTPELKLIKVSNQNNENNKEDLIIVDNKEIKLKYVTPCQFEKLLNDDNNKSDSRHICDCKEIDPFEENNEISKSEMCVFNLEVNSLSRISKTASDTPIKKSYQSLDKTKAIFQNFDSINEKNENLEERHFYPIQNTELITFQEFTTTRTEPDKLSTSALTKTKNVFQHIIDIGNNVGKDDVLKMLTSADNPVFQGFKTANNKSIAVTMKQLAKSKNMFQHIFDNSAPNVEFNNNSDETSKKVFHDIDNCNEKNNDTIAKEKQLHPMTNKYGNAIYLGFETAANKQIGISTEALAKSKKAFQDIDDEENNVVNDSDNISKEKPPRSIAHVSINTPICQGFKTAANKRIGISAEALAKSKKVFEGTDDKESNIVKDSDNISKEKQPYPIANTSLNTAMCEGFKTAANKPGGVCAEALVKSKKIFQNIAVEEINIVKDSDNISKEKQPYPIANTSLNNGICQGFKTAANKRIGISAEALAKSKKVFQGIDDEESNIVKDSDNISKEKQPCPIANTHLNTAICQGFKTAANKRIGISAEALAKSKKIFQGIDDEERNIVNDSDNTIKQKQLYPIARNSQNAICQGFKTAGNKPVGISEDALAKSKKIFVNMDNDCETKQIPVEVVEKQPEIVPKRQWDFIGFDTASNKKVKVSENALLKSRQVLQNANFGFKDENCIFKNPSNLVAHKIKAIDKSLSNFGFKTGNNTQINISEEALKNCRNIFSDLDESIKSNADPKLNLDVVISENNILEDFNTEIIKDFEDTVYTEDFIKNETPKSKRSGSPILSCPNSKKRKKFESPIIIKKFVAPTNRQSTIKIDTSNVYSFDENYKKIKKYTLKDLNEIEKIRTIKDVDPYISNFRFETVLDFEFMGERNDIDNDRWTTDKIKGCFTDSVNKRFIPEGWIENHLKMIIWKLVSYEIRFPGAMKNVCTVRNVLEQLKYRYDRELYNVERPVLRKIVEKDEVSSKLMVLCVADLFIEGVSVCSVTNQNQNIELLLTDGWYAIKASTDRMIDKLVCEGKISVGTKLAIHGAELLNCEQGIAPWEDTSSVRLKISGNSTRRAIWDARLGLHGNVAILSRLSAVKPEGGRVSQLRTLVTRVYPTLYIEKFPDGSTLTRSERLEHIYQMKYETEQQIQMERLCEELERFSDQESQDSEGLCLEDRAMESGSQISRLMKKSRDREEFRATLTSWQAHLLQQHSLKQKEKLIQALQDKFQKLVEKRGLDSPRNVVPLMKIRVADVETAGVTKAMVTIWKPNETLQEMLTEGTWIDLYNVVPTSVRYSEIQISAGRQSVFRRSKLNETDKLKTITKTLTRQCYTTKDLQNPSMNTDYNEVDTVGFIFMIEPQTMEFEKKNQPFQNVYLTDENKNIICVNFWGGIKKFGFQNLLDTGQIVTCVNLQKRAGNTRKNIPQYRATEFTYFTKTPKNDSVRKLVDDLTAKFSSLDKRKFIDDCVAFKNNYHIVKGGNTENVSPYRLNTSDYNVYKNKVFIDSPLAYKCTDVNFNLTGLDFESTFKQTDTQDISPQMLLKKRKVKEKIAKLEMYGEAPPLNPIHLINKSSNAIKAFRSPLTKNDISTSVASPSSLPQNKDETQNRVNKVDSSPVLCVNRTYVKRDSINPVKLNFSNAIETSITDPFAEEFDGSPPLSLDVESVT